MANDNSDILTKLIFTGVTGFIGLATFASAQLYLGLYARLERIEGLTQETNVYAREWVARFSVTEARADKNGAELERRTAIITKVSTEIANIKDRLDKLERR